MAGTAAFLISLCDSYGYLSTVALYLYQTFGGGKAAWAPLLTTGGYLLATVLPLLMLGALSCLAGKRREIIPESSVPLTVSPGQPLP